jgi:hypothetical protein
MNPVVRIILGLGALALVGGCAVSTQPDDESEGASSAELSAAQEDAVGAPDDNASGTPQVRLPDRPTRAAIVAPGTENESPSDPSPWRGKAPRP